MPSLMISVSVYPAARTISYVLISSRRTRPHGRAVITVFSLICTVNRALIRIYFVIQCQTKKIKKDPHRMANGTDEICIDAGIITYGSIRTIFTRFPSHDFGTQTRAVVPEGLATFSTTSYPSIS